MKCKICDKDCNGIRGLSIHLTKKHFLDSNQLKDYYDKYLKKKNEGKCYFCNTDTPFKNMGIGYHKICESKECLGKTRATGTYEFLMYKYNLSKDDAIKMMNDRALDRGIKIKDGLHKSYIKNNNFFKERSHQSVEYWIKKGYTEEESIKKVKDVTDIIHNKTWKKRKKFPELYQDVNTTQIGYWLKKGYTEEESKDKIKDRQNTFTLEKCIIKHGIVKGLSKWNERQIKWVSSMKKSILLNGNFRKDYSKVEMEFVDKILSIIKIKDNEHYSYTNNQFFVYNKKEKRFFTYDFVIKDTKKVIEFNGNYWHCNPNIYKENFFNKNKQMFAKDIWENDKIKINSIEELGYEVLIIWENDYKQNKEKTIQECINFIKNKENNGN